MNREEYVERMKKQIDELTEEFHCAVRKQPPHGSAPRGRTPMSLALIIDTPPFGNQQ